MKKILFLVLISLIGCSKDIRTELLKQEYNFVRLRNVQKTGGATGFALKAPSGKVYTITNAHVCEMKNKDNVILGDMNEEGSLQYELKVLYESEKTDLCVVSPMPRMTGLNLASMDAKKNDKIFAIGYPSLDPLQDNTLGRLLLKTRLEVFDSTPIDKCTKLKQKIKKVPGSLLGFPIEDEICVLDVQSWITNMFIYPGNSGSPVFNIKGEVIGVVFAGNPRNDKGSIIPYDDLVELLEGF